MLFQVLGPVAVLDGDATVNLGGPQQRRLLAVLLVEPGRTVHNDRLLEVLWPDGEPESGLRTVRTYVSRLRTAIGDGYVRTTAVGYEIDLNGSAVDANRFGDLLETARQSRPLTALSLLDEALALWRGPALGDFGSEWWAAPFVRKYEELRLNALAERIDAMAARGWEAGALAEVAGLVSEHPLHEPFVERLMRGLQATGRHAEALRAFQEYRGTLGDQTGVEPSAELTALERFIAAASPSSDGSSATRSLRGYTIHEPIGSGEFGAVYRATQPGLDRDVALKVIRPELASSRAFIQRFEVEAQFVALLEHPNIVPLYDYWRDPSGAYLVFRLLRGRSAADRLATRGPLSVEAVTNVVNQIGGALASAHLRGVAHRDVKPANILFDESDIAYLSDFGIARIDEHSLQRELDRRSPRYAAGAALMSDAPLDQYLLAATAWELLAGRPPFERSSASVSGHTPLDALPPIADVRSDVPRAVADVLCRAGAGADRNRFDSVAEFVDAWNSALVAGVSASRPVVDVARSAVNPYCGLRAFGEADAFYFQGRTTLTDGLEAMVRRARFVTVVGPSGSGKSSLVRAGLIPRMRRDGSMVVTLVPGADPMSALSEAALAVASRDNADRLLPTAIVEPGGLRRALAVLGGNADLTIVLDQFEELWTLASTSKREQFLEGLLDAVTAEGVRVVATVRADLYGLALAHPRLGPVVAAASYPVTPMSAAELHDAIVLPAARVGVTVEERLAAVLAAEVLDRPGSLPLLEFTLAELFERRDVDTITEREYDELGGLSGSVGREAERIFERGGPAEQAATRAMFERLVTLSAEGGQAVRRPARRTELAAVPDCVIDAFVDRRLLVSDRDRDTREPTVELAHEIILTAWPRLQDWLDADRVWLTSLRVIREGAAAWDRSGRDEGELLRGARLVAVTEQLERRRDQITTTEAEYVDESCATAELERTAVERQLATQVRANRRLRRSLITVGVVLVAALVASLIAVTQRRHAQAARRDALVTTLEARSLALRSSQRDVAALLAVEAADLRPDERWPSALLGTFTLDPGFLGYVDFDGQQSVVGGIMPGTSKAVVGPITRTIGADNPPLRTVDLLTGEQGPLFEPMGPHDHGTFRVAVSGNGRRVAEYGYQYVDGWQPPTLYVYDTTTGKKIGTPIQISDDPDAINFTIALNADGSQVAVSAAERGDTRIFDTGDARLVATVPPAPDALQSFRGRDTSSAVWAPDGRLFVGSSGTHLRVLDPDTFDVIEDFTVPGIATGGALEFSDDGAVLVARGVNQDPETFEQSGTVVRIDPANGTVLWTIDSDEYGDGQCDSIAFSVAEDRMWCGDYFGTIRVRSLSTGALDGTTISHQRGWLSSLNVATINGGRYLVSMGWNSAVVGRWRIDGLGPVQRRIAAGYDWMRYSPDGSSALVFGPDDSSPNGFTAAVWDPASDRQVISLDGEFVDAGWIGNDRVAEVAGDGSITVVSVPSGATERAQLSVEPDWLLLTFLPDGFVATGYDDGRVVLRGIDDGSVVTMQLTNPARTFQPTAISVALAADGSAVYVGAQGGWAFDRATGRQVATNEDTQIGGIFTSSTGAIVATLFDGTIERLDSSLRVIASVPGARGWVSDVRFSNDGALLAARGNDDTVSLYDVASVERIGDPIALPDNATIDVNPAGTELSIAAPDGVVIWSLDRARWTNAACHIADRDLTPAERDTYLAGLGDGAATCQSVD